MLWRSQSDERHWLWKDKLMNVLCFPKNRVSTKFHPPQLYWGEGRNLRREYLCKIKPSAWLAFSKGLVRQYVFFFIWLNLPF